MERVMKKSIFIQITSYHDYEIKKTIIDAIDKSSGKTELVFGVHSIFYNENSWIEPVKNMSSVKLIESKAPDNLGIGLGRFISHSLYSGEDYYLQIDAHSRFDLGWDIFLINEIETHKANGFKKPLITQYPKPFWYEGEIEKTRDGEEAVTQFYWKDKQRFKDSRVSLQGTIVNKEKNIFSISVSGGCIFTEGEFLKPNKLIFAEGEEIFTAARAYTNGYDLFVPSKMFMYHLYYGAEGKNKRRLAFEDWPKETIRLGDISHNEIKFVLTGEGVVGEYRLGTERSLSEYGKFAGLDFNSGEILDNFSC